MTRATTTAADVKPTALEHDAVALQTAVADLVRVYQFRDRDRICCHDISVTQCHALETLIEHGPMRLGALAEGLLLDKSTTSRVIGTLVKKGYVEQQAEASDRRATRLQATPKGRRLCARITEDLVEQQKELLQEMAPDVRAGVIQVIRGLARAADARFRAGVSAGSSASCCAPGENGGTVCR